MLKSRKTLRFAIPCLALVVLALALSVQRWSAHAQSEQDPVTQSAQEPIRIRPMPPAVENFGAQAATVPNGPSATITVNSLADGAPANDGQCTLREALLNANNDNQSGSTDCASGSGTDTIAFSVTGTIMLTNGELNISSSLNLVGPSATLLTVSGNNTSRIFNILDGNFSVAISGLTIANGQTFGKGGGILNSNNGTVDITNCAFVGNVASEGAGVEHANAGTMNITNCTFSGNSGSKAAAIHSTVATLNLVNSTISGNTVTVFGGAIDMFNSTATITNSTIAFNSSNFEAGGVYVSNGTLSLKNSIIAQNNAPTGPDISAAFGTVNSLGYNLIGNTAGFTLTGDTVTNLLNINPQLLPLGNYGGTTQTHALLAGSPAIDAGTATGAPANDQRGFARGGNGRGFGADGYDIGAYELRPKFINVTTGNDANSGATLALPIKTIAHGIAIASLGDDLVIASGTYPENNLVVGAFINFQGAGAASTIVNGGQINRVFQINGGSQVGITNLTITNGKTASGQLGGGILNNGTLSLANCVVSGNSAPNGNGAGLSTLGSTALVTITNSTISGNNAGAIGGGISQGGGRLTILNSTISGNSAAQAGGLSFNSGTAVLTNVTISGNTASFWPGGILHFGSTGQSSLLLLTNCTVTGNNGDSMFGAIVTQDSGAAVSVVTQLKNTIVSSNVGPTFTAAGTNASISSLGNNLASDNAGGFLNGTGDLINTNPLLAALADNGGPTQTHLPQSGSPAINAGSNTGAPATDQRGVKRPVGANKDIGAVEVSSGTCATSVIYPSSLPPGAVGAIYNQQLTATGGTAPYIFSVATGSSLPAGLSLSSSGLLSGTPTTSGNPTFSLSVLDQNGCLSTQAFAMHISASGCSYDSATPITIGQTLSGQLLPGDCTALFGDGSLSDYFSFSGTAGQQVAISMNSTDVDSYLVLFSPALQNLGEDDNGGGGTNARIPASSGFYTLPTTGTYLIAAATYPGQTGNYSLTLSGPPNNGLQFYPLAAPVRLLDTRNGTSPNACIQRNAPFFGNQTVILGARNFCSIPSNAIAITGNVTTVQPSGSGFLTFFPTDAMQPTVANTNFTLNSVINNVYTVGLGGLNGTFNIFASTTTEVVVDVTGYYAPPASGGLYFHPLAAPVRLLETRTGQAIGCFKPGMPISANGTLNQQGSGTCGIPATAKALVGNATSVLPPGPGFLTLYPNGAMQPFVATSNYRGSDVINGPFTVALGTGGQFNIFSSNTANVVVDILGYFSLEALDASGPGLLFNQIPHPVRLLETRSSPPTLVGCVKPGFRLQSQTTVYNLIATNSCESIGFSAAQAIVGNATVVAPDNNGFMTLFPVGQPLPFTAASNFRTGVANNRHFFVGLNTTTGDFSIFFNMGGTQFFTDLVIDVSGYFAP